MTNRKIKIIVVDDENRIRRGIERLILSSGDDFEIVGSYISGTKLMKEYQKENIIFDLLITDIKMPGIDGLELIRELKAEASFEAVVISGFNDFKYVQTAIREGALDYMVKPLIREDFRKQLEKIKEKIQEKWENEKKLQVMDSELHYVKQIQRLSDLIRRQDIDLAELEWTRDFPKGGYFLLYISIDQNVKKEQAWPQSTVIEKRIVGVLTNYHDRTHHKYWFWKGEETSFWVLVHDEKSVDYSEIQLAEEIRVSIKSENHVSATIAISKRFIEVALLPALRDDLISLLQFRLLYGGNQIYTVSAVENMMKERKRTKESKELEITMSKVLESLDPLKKEAVFHYLEQFHLELKKLCSPIEIEQSIQVLAVQSVNRILKKVIANDKIKLVQEALQLTEKSPNFTELKVNIKAWMQKVLNILEEMNQHEMKDPIESAKRWIHQNLGDNLTIEKIAKKVHMNPTYFCEYFKNQTGETILEFVTKARIEKSRDLLLSTELKIYDISQQVGYTDTKYFSKLFRKYYGEVPSKYKTKENNLYN